jgi:pilus assembly protein Flp/PilA
MNDMFLKLYVKMQSLMAQEEGQDLIEYVLIVGLISVAIVAGLQGVATHMNTILTSITTTLTNA